MKKLLYIALVLVFTSVVWFGCKEKENLPGELHGAVTDKATGEPIKSAGVELQPIGLKTVTGIDGQYGFNEIEPGKYKLYITKTGYAEWLSNEIIVKSEQIAQSDVQLEKLPPALQILDDKGSEIDELDFGSYEDEVTRSFSIFNSGDITLEWEVISTANWIQSVSKTSGALVSGNIYPIIVTIERNALKIGENRTNVHITSNNGSRQLIIKAEKKGAVSTVAIENILETSAVFVGSVNELGDPTYMERGFVYSSTVRTPVLGSTGCKQVAVTGMAIGNYSTTVINLIPETTYYVCAYVRSEGKVEYGEVKEFKTMEAPYVVMRVVGLMVQKEDLGKGDIGTAKLLCRGSTLAGYTDWRLPSVEELMVLYNNRQLIGGFQADNYWTNHSWNDASYIYYYRYISFVDGSFGDAHNYNHCRVRAVRTITE